MKQTISRILIALLAGLVCLGLAGCGKPLSDTSSKPAKPLAASPSTRVIGQAPAEPEGSGEKKPGAGEPTR